MKIAKTTYPENPLPFNEWMQYIFSLLNTKK
jgi:hypothetical protein